MRIHQLLLTSLLLLALAAPTAAAAPPAPPPLVGVCVDDVTHSGCYGGNWICVSISYMVPQCVEHQTITCTEICSPCTKIAGCEFVEDTIHVCVAGTTEPSCYGFHDVCVEVSRMVPFCVDKGVECTEACNPCMPIQCEPTPQRGPEPMCMYYYYELDLGAVRYVQRDSCHSELWVNGERVR